MVTRSLALNAERRPACITAMSEVTRRTFPPAHEPRMLLSHAQSSMCAACHSSLSGRGRLLSGHLRVAPDDRVALIA